MSLLIGIDVGGTNTDLVLIDPKQLTNDNHGVLSWHKATTTAQVEHGITEAISKLFPENCKYSPADVCAVTIGTTHFINAVIEQDEARLDPVSVIRLSSYYSQGTSPFSDFPKGLRNIVEGDHFFIKGGHRVDGSEIQPLDEKAIVVAAEKIRDSGVNCVAINGIFSFLDPSHETRAEEIVRRVIPGANIVCSHEVSAIGFLARENAAILNALVMRFAATIIASFTNSVEKLGFTCPILLTQNDGTVTTDAVKVPIRTFALGATNSMRGAGFLLPKDHKLTGQSVMVVDIGGTTTDVGLLLPLGFPRQCSSHSEVGGVRMNFSMPHVESIGLGGGSRVRRLNGALTVGPDSVGADLAAKAVVFGGNEDTATDLTMAQFPHHGVGLANTVAERYNSDELAVFSKVVLQKLERVIDRMKTSPGDVPVVVVGGGAFMAPLELAGALTVVRPPHALVANAIGAALARVSAEVARMAIVDSAEQRDAIVAQMKEDAVARARDNGADPRTVEIIDVVNDPVPYVDRVYSFRVKAVGDVDYARIAEVFKDRPKELVVSVAIGKKSRVDAAAAAAAATADIAADLEKYRPTVTRAREWLVLETDVQFLEIGTYILGCGGGGNPRAGILEATNMLRAGVTMRVVAAADAANTSPDGRDSIYFPVGFAGSPTVSTEQLAGDELVEAAHALFDYFHQRADGLLAVEIGGGNGIQALLAGASSKLDLPVIDADLMGRAYPTAHQILPCVLMEERFLKVCALSDGNGNSMLITGAQSDAYVEKMARAALAEIGAHVGTVNNKMSYSQINDMAVPNSLSLAWRIGRAVLIARQKRQIDRLPELILDSIGVGSGKAIFRGKIISVEKKLFKGHVYGEILIENEAKDILCIPFKNENIAAKLKRKDSNEFQIIALVPDLISVCFDDSGEAVGTPEYRYGIMVFVIAFAPYTKWTNTEKALSIGGPKAFGPAFESIAYQPVGDYVPPKSVIDEYYPVD